MPGAGCGTDNLDLRDGRRRVRDNDLPTDPIANDNVMTVRFATHGQHGGDRRNQNPIYVSFHNLLPHQFKQGR